MVHWGYDRYLFRAGRGIDALNPAQSGVREYGEMSRGCTILAAVVRMSSLITIIAIGKGPNSVSDKVYPATTTGDADGHQLLEVRPRHRAAHK